MLHRVLVAAVPPDRRIELRIGIHVGDIIIEEGDIFAHRIGNAAGIRDHLQTRRDVDRIALAHAALERVCRRFEPRRSITEAMFRSSALAVLPLANISGDPEQEYFADGLTEDIITALSLCGGRFR